MPAAVEAVFRAYPPRMRAKLLALRHLICVTAAELDGVGAVEETLRWGQPSYLTRTGSTIRIDQVKAEPGRYALYFICHTDLVAQFRALYPHLTYGGNRSILLEAEAALPEPALRHCIALALTYKARKNRRDDTPASC